MREINENPNLEHNLERSQQLASYLDNRLDSFGLEKLHITFVSDDTIEDREHMQLPEDESTHPKPSLNWIPSSLRSFITDNQLLLDIPSAVPIALNLSVTRTHKDTEPFIDLNFELFCETAGPTQQQGVRYPDGVRIDGRRANRVLANNRYYINLPVVREGLDRAAVDPKVTIQRGGLFSLPRTSYPCDGKVDEYPEIEESYTSTLDSIFSFFQKHHRMLDPNSRALDSNGSLVLRKVEGKYRILNQIGLKDGFHGLLFKFLKYKSPNILDTDSLIEMLTNSELTSFMSKVEEDQVFWASEPTPKQYQKMLISRSRSCGKNYLKQELALFLASTVEA